MRKDQTTMKVWPSTHEKLRAIAAATGVPMVRLLDKWADRELARLRSGDVKTATAKLGGIVRGIVVGPVAATLTADSDEYRASATYFSDLIDQVEGDNDGTE